MNIRKIGLCLVMIMIIFCLGGCKDNKQSDALTFKEEYESLNGMESKSGKIYPDIEISEDNKIKYITMKEASDIIKNKSGVIYFGFPTCPWCRNAVPVLLNVADNTTIDYIYYVDMTDMRDELEVLEDGSISTVNKASDDYYELLDTLGDILDDYTLTDESGNEVSTGEKRIYVPLVVFIKDGKLVGYHSDTVESQEDPYILLNTEQQEELYSIYSTGIHDVLDDICDEEERC